MKIIIKTLFGFEEILAEEVKCLGGESVEKITRGVKCEGNPAFLYRANLSLRTAMKIMVPIHTFHAKNEKQLYDNMMEFDWSHFLDVDQTFAIDTVVFSELFTHSKFVGYKSKDAIVDWFRNKYRRRPSINTDSPDVQLNVHCANDFFTVSMDSSGAALNQRGYREDGHKAPMNEVLAAGMLILSGWDKKESIVDPMCGSGTILTEAAMMTMNMGPNLKRKEFGFRTWPQYSPILFYNILNEEKSKIRRPHMNIMGIDNNDKAVQLAKKALGKIGLRREVRVSTMDFREFKPLNKKGIIVTNPPYGERIGDDMPSFYQSIGDAFKQNFTGYDAWLISSNKKALRQIGLKDSKRITLYNGKLKCDFAKYELY
ncbi:MAG: class I SAM-dependent RNA methyltransferase [Ekhidna sp.]|nr:class I SAM-dependent RNA methyltransferase [Ekhidna sp.]MBC6409092.1 class I SAM-dependent RNA methyltransferase [Ekhidna sp.]MBC6426903.1 class I SAM-dependent RNA methyltransferase [Ekhidna sp.]